MLITAESIIAGFMIAYATLVSQMLFNWSTVKGASLFTTFQAGLLASAVVLTCFRSIFLLYRSTAPTNADKNSDYGVGYDMFIAAILLSGIYVMLNVLSIFHFTFLSSLSIKPTPIPTPWDFGSSFFELVLFSLYIWILLHKPRCIQKAVKCLTQGRGRKYAEKFGWAGVCLAVLYFFLHLWIFGS